MASSKRIGIMKYHYNLAKTAKTGSEIICPACNHRHTKTSYQKVFCSNKGNRNCKDKFWNTVDPEKRCRKTPYFEDVIMPAIAKERGFPDVQTMREYVDETDALSVSVENCEWCGLRAEYCRCCDNDV